MTCLAALEVLVKGSMSVHRNQSHGFQELSTHGPRHGQDREIYVPHGLSIPPTIMEGDPDPW